MIYLLDTNILLWLLKGYRHKIGSIAWELLAKTATTNFRCSTASLWEIRIKVSSGKLEAPDNIEERLAARGVEVMPITPAHTRPLETLELRHKDPFDRMLIAQALTEKLTVITSDSKIMRYPEVSCIDAQK